MVRILPQPHSAALYCCPNVRLMTLLPAASLYMDVLDYVKLHTPQREFGNCLFLS